MKDLKELKKELPYKWRVQSFSQSSKKATCVAYIDSRDVQDLLDDVCGPENWQDDYFEVKGNVYCKIGIRVNDSWVWKSDCGIESNVDAQKGEASDAFKRAAVKWGIGRFLYHLEIKYVDSNEVKTKTNRPYVVDSKGSRVWDITKHINSLQPEKKKPNPPKDLPGQQMLSPENEKLWKAAIDKIQKGESTINDIKLKVILTKENEEKLKEALQTVES